MTTQDRLSDLPDVEIEGLDELNAPLEDGEAPESPPAGAEIAAQPSPSSEDAAPAVAPPAADAADSPPPAEPTPVEKRLAEVEAELARTREAEARRAADAADQRLVAEANAFIENHLAQRKAELENQGELPEQIALRLNHEKQTFWGNFGAHRQKQQEQRALTQGLQQGLARAMALGDQHQLTLAEVKELMAQPSLQAMDLLAENFRLKREMTASKKAAVRPTRYDTSARPAAAPASDEQLLLRYENGEVSADHPGVRQALRNAGYR